MQQPGILQPAEADSPSIGHRRFTVSTVTEAGSVSRGETLTQPPSQVSHCAGLG
jgi:hypothetical protein